MSCGKLTLVGFGKCSVYYYCIAPSNPVNCGKLYGLTPEEIKIVEGETARKR